LEGTEIVMDGLNEKEPSGDQGSTEPDPIDEAAAEIDPRSAEAPEQIDDLKDLAESLGRDVEE
jgi:hypothetical protein